MNEDQRSLKVFLGILAVLAVLGALWRVMTYQPGSPVPATRPAVTHTQATPVAETVPTPNGTVNELLAEPTSSGVPGQNRPNRLPATSAQVETSPRVPYPQNRSTVKQTYVPRAQTGQRYVDQNFYTSDTKTPTSYQTGTSSYSSSGFTSPQVNFNTSTAARLQEERAGMLAPYLRPNKQDKARMDAQWNKMAAALERAIAKALTPKSKKEEMIEKYAAKAPSAVTSQTPGFTGQLAPVGEQLAVQKQQMMQSMGSAFGSAAAQQTGGIMDSFAGELAGILNAPNLTAAEKEKQVKELTHKYQDKMDKLAQKNQYDKFVAARTEQINQQKEAFRAKYDEQLSDKLGQILEDEWQQEQQLATQNLPVDEYNTKIAQLHQQKRNELQQTVLEQGQSVNPLLEMEKQQEEKALKELQAKVEAGEVESVARAATPNEIKQMQADLKVKSADTLDKIAKDPLLGPKAAEEFKPILDNYQQQLNTLYQQELSVDERRQKEGELLKSVNRQLLDKQIASIEKLDLPEAQKQSILDELNQAYNAL